MGDPTSSQDSSLIDFDRGSSSYYNTIAELQDTRYRETGLTNQASGSRAQNAGSLTRLVSIYTRKYCVKPTPKCPEFDRAKSPLFPEFAPRTTHPSLPKIQRRSQFPVLLPKEVRLLVPPSVQTNCHRSPKVQVRRSKVDVSG